jgi:adenylate kinase family enzyme
VVHLDRSCWRPGWVATPAEEWEAARTDLAAGERWIIDGNYGGTLNVRFARADTVIVLALPRWRCLVRVLGR